MLTSFRIGVVSQFVGFVFNLDLYTPGEKKA